MNFRERPVVEEEMAIGVKEGRLEHNDQIVYILEITKQNKPLLSHRGLGVVFEFTTPDGETVFVPAGSTFKVVPAREE